MNLVVVGGTPTFHPQQALRSSVNPCLLPSFAHSVTRAARSGMLSGCRSCSSGHAHKLGVLCTFMTLPVHVDRVTLGRSPLRKPGVPLAAGMLVGPRAPLQHDFLGGTPLTVTLCSTSPEQTPRAHTRPMLLFLLALAPFPSSRSCLTAVCVHEIQRFASLCTHPANL